MSTNENRQDYGVEWRSPSEVFPSPENVELYGHVNDDEQMQALTASIGAIGLQEPIIVTSDYNILSGHRRYHACTKLGMQEIPVRVTDISRETTEDYLRLLSQFNPQRVKTPGMLLREALLRLNVEDDPRALLLRHEEEAVAVDVEFTRVDGCKFVEKVSVRRMEFLEAAMQVIDDLFDFWPLSIRQVHYHLLNDPPLKQTVKKSKYGPEYYRYRNDDSSYDALVRLLRSARHHGHVDMSAIDDPTRPQIIKRGYASVSAFIDSQLSGFLNGYHRSPQLDQPRHIEVFGEKNTLLSILKPVCTEYYVPLSLGRGYASIPVWRDMAQRFKRSGKSAMTLIVASDYDPEGIDLADDAVRSLRDLWDVPVDYHRVGVTREQIDELNLAEDFNPAKPSSSRYKAFVKRTKGKKSWELEALPPAHLQDLVRDAIEGSMDMETYQHSIEQEQADAGELLEFRRSLVDSLGLD